MELSDQISSNVRVLFRYWRYIYIRSAFLSCFVIIFSVSSALKIHGLAKRATHVLPREFLCQVCNWGQVNVLFPKRDNVLELVELMLWQKETWKKWTTARPFECQEPRGTLQLWVGEGGLVWKGRISDKILECKNHEDKRWKSPIGTTAAKVHREDQTRLWA